MLLAIDIGNSRIKFGLFDGTALQRTGGVSHADVRTLADEVGNAAVTQIALCSVVPSMAERVIPLLAMRYSMPVRVAGRDLPFGIDVQCDEPGKVGADRILNAIAAHARTQTATIVADVGSAVTVDVVTARGSFGGGAIAPGPETMLKALHEHAALLPEAAVGETPPAVGHNTEAALRSGAYWGTVGLVERLITQIAEDQGIHSPALVTGGAGEWVAANLNTPAEHIPHLTLEGLAISAGR